MMGNRKGSSIFVLAVLSFSAVSSLSVIPRISRTGDAVIIDFADQDVAPYQEKDVYSEVADPEYVPVQPQFNPYQMVFQQHTRNSNGWSYFYGYPSLVAPAVPAADPSVRQSEDYEGELEEDFSEVQLEKQAPAPAPAPATCGRGPAAMPATRTSIAGRISYPDTYTTSAAKKGAWPFIVALRKTGEAAAFCAGSLISDTRVVLAAQCLEKLSVFEISGVTVLVGMHRKDFTDVQMTRRISKVIIHSGYNAATYTNDIAVIIMDSPVVLSKTVSPICLPAQSADPDQFVDQNAMILGWDAKVSTIASLEQALVSISANADCRADTIFGQFVSDSTTCVTNGAANNIFTCLKDVGGPVVIGVPPAPPATTPVTWTLVGINSYTATSTDCNRGGLKTRVAAFRTWIDKAI